MFSFPKNNNVLNFIPKILTGSFLGVIICRVSGRKVQLIVTKRMNNVTGVDVVLWQLHSRLRVERADGRERERP